MEVLGILVLLIVMVLFGSIGMLISAITKGIIAHICVALMVYRGIAFLIGWLLDCKIIWRFISGIANMLMFLPFASVEVLYTFPYIMRRPNHLVEGIVEFVIVTWLMVAITAFVGMLEFSSEGSDDATEGAKCVWRLILSIIYCVIVGILLKQYYITPEYIEVLCNIYGFTG